MLLFIIIFITLLVVTIFGYRTRFAYAMSLYFFGIFVLIFSGLLYFSSISAFELNSNFSYRIGLLLSKLSLNINSISVIHNVGISIIMLASIVCINLLYPQKKFINIILCIPVMFFFYINLPEIDWKLFIELQTIAYEGNKFVLLDFCHMLGNAIVVIYMILPIVIFGHYTYNTKIFVKKRYGIASLICFLSLYLIAYLLFINGIFSPIMFYNVDLMNFPQTEIGIYNNDVLTIFSSLCIVLFDFLIIFYFKPFEKRIVDNRRSFNKRSRIINNNMYMVMHVYKNTFLAIQKLAKIGINAQKEENEAEVLDMFFKIEDEAEKSFHDITHILSMLNNITVDYRVFVLENCIAEAIKKSSAEEKSVTITYSNKSTMVLGSKKHITECFVNIINNAVETINQKNDNYGGLIKISTHIESDMICVMIEDNGFGIAKKDIKKVFQPFYTTKTKKVGSGLGLDYVKNVVVIHGGDIDIKSIVGSGTTVYVALPIYKVQRRKEYEAFDL